MFLDQIVKVWNIENKERLENLSLWRVVISIDTLWHTHLCPFSKSKFNLVAPARARYNTNWDRKGWPSSEIQMYHGCPWTVTFPEWFKVCTFGFMDHLKLKKLCKEDKSGTIWCTAVSGRNVKKTFLKKLQNACLSRNGCSWCIFVDVKHSNFSFRLRDVDYTYY